MILPHASSPFFHPGEYHPLPPTFVALHNDMHSPLIFHVELSPRIPHFLTLLPLPSTFPGTCEEHEGVFIFLGEEPE